MEITFVLLLSFRFFFFSSVSLFILRHFFKPMKQSRAIWRTSSYASYFRIPKICDECCRCLLNVSKRQHLSSSLNRQSQTKRDNYGGRGGGGGVRVLNKVLYGDCFTPRSHLLPFYIPFLTDKVPLSFTFYLTNCSCVSTREVWRVRIIVSQGAAESNCSLLSTLQTSQVLNISTCAQLKHELIVL